MSWIIQEKQIRDFYSEIKFPGPYNIEDFLFYDHGYTNNFLNVYDQAIQNSNTILDVGCGSGFLTNYFAYKYPNKKFVGIDFSDGIDYAKEFAKTHQITNVSYTKKNFFDAPTSKKYDCIISNGVIHHMPLYEKAIYKIKDMLEDHGVLVLGIYNKFGKLAKKFMNVTYRSELLRRDQDEAPFELSFTNSEFIKHFPEFDTAEIHPSWNNKFTDIRNLLNYHNGGLTIYRLQRKPQ
jgi:2-polyprenyl-3-methyl-5-hydroxy-6-metoxy-1,4-benzoquinol methylase